MGKLEQAIAAIKAGDKTTGGRLLAEIVQTDPRNEEAWLGLAEIVDDPARKQECLRRARAIRESRQAARPIVRDGISQPGAIPRPPDSSPHRSWYRTPVVYILTFLFLTPVWVILILTDRRQSKLVKAAAWLMTIVEICGCLYFVVLPWYRYSSTTSSLLHHTITYRASSDSSYYMSVTVQNTTDAGSQTDQKDAYGKGWEAEYTLKNGDFAYLAVTTGDYNSDATCEIWVDGNLWRRSNAHGDFPIAVCSGVVGTR